MTPKNATRALAAALVLASAACADAPSSPLASAPRAPRLATSTTIGDTTTTTFRVDPKDTRIIVVVGTHKLDIPPGAICDLETSGYGPAYWDQPCRSEESPVTFTAKTWTDANGHPRIVFAPDVRFSPSEVVTLSIKDPKGVLDPNAVVAWCPTGGTTCVNEAIADPSLATRADVQGSFLVRRVKHFSGYHVIAWGDDEGGSQFGQ